MATCLKCGTLIHDDDVDKHKCKEEDKPTKGTEVKLSRA